MSRSLRTLTLAVLLATAVASAQTSGTAFPLTNTRYGTASATLTLRSNGQDVVLFTLGRRHIRATKLVDGRDRAGDEVFATGDRFDAVWTGTHFLAATHVDYHTRIIGRRVDRDGHPLGAPFTILANARDPVLAAGHGAVLMIYQNETNETRATLLTRDGSGAGAGIKISEPFARAAATPDGFVVAAAGGSRVIVTMLDTHGNLVSERTIVNAAGSASSVAVASHGNASVVVWANYDEMGIVRISGDGTPGAQLILEKTPTDAGPGQHVFAGNPDVAWNGAGWTVLYQTGYSKQRVRVAHLDANAQQVVGREEAPADTRSPALAILGTRTIAAWSRSSGFFDPAYVTDLPFAQNTPRVASFGAMEQSVLAATSSPNAALFAWDEEGDDVRALRVGVRTHDGQWRERKLADVYPGFGFMPAQAASDGRNFLFIAKKQAWFLDESGAPLGAPLTLPREVELLVWNGARYVLFSNDGVRTLTPAGALSAPVQLPIDFGVTSAASDGNGIVVAGGDFWCPFLLCYPINARAARLTRELARADAQDMRFAEEIGSLYGVAWNGAEYVVAWDDGIDDTSIARIPAAPGAAPHVQQIANRPFFGISIVATSDGNVAMLGHAEGWNTVMYVGRDGSVKGTAKVRPLVSDPWETLGLVPLAGGAVAFVDGSRNDAAPHYGAWRMKATVVAANPPSLPGAPQITVRDEGTRFDVAWTAPAGTVNGYRVESRIDEGVWIELERWFGPGEQSASIRKPAYGTTFELRVRAVNDAGLGPYSNSARAQTSRKGRALRIR